MLGPARHLARRHLLHAALVGLALLLTAPDAFAQATRTWVSGVGDDANPCSRTAPCKTFAGAISKTAAGGEIDALDPGGFGVVTITKSITISGNGNLAGVLASASVGITIAAGNTDTVILRGLTVTCANAGACPTQAGIRYVSGLIVHVEDTTITGFSGGAIDFAPTTAGAMLLVKRAGITGNSGGGILVGQMGQAVISKSHIFNSGTGVRASETSRVSVHDTVFAGNVAQGIHVRHSAVLNMDRGLVAGNGVGVQGDSTVRLSDVMIGHNTTGVAGLQVRSFGNNRIAAGNVTDGAPTSTLPQQ